MGIDANNKEKSILYSLMKITTDYDSRWINGNIEKYDKVLLKRTCDRIYNSRKAIYKYYNVKMENMEKESSDDMDINKEDIIEKHDSISDLDDSETIII